MSGPIYFEEIITSLPERDFEKEVTIFQINFNQIFYVSWIAYKAPAGYQHNIGI